MSGDVMLESSWSSFEFTVYHKKILFMSIMSRISDHHLRIAII